MWLNWDLSSSRIDDHRLCLRSELQWVQPAMHSVCSTSLSLYACIWRHTHPCMLRWSWPPSPSVIIHSRSPCQHPVWHHVWANLRDVVPLAAALCLFCSHLPRAVSHTKSPRSENTTVNRAKDVVFSSSPIGKSWARNNWNFILGTAV